MLRGNHLEKLIERLTRYLATVVGKDTSAPAGKPDLGGIRRGHPLAHVNVNGLTGLVRSEEHSVTADKKEARQP